MIGYKIFSCLGNKIMGMDTGRGYEYEIGKTYKAKKGFPFWLFGDQGAVDKYLKTFSGKNFLVGEVDYSPSEEVPKLKKYETYPKGTVFAKSFRLLSIIMVEHKMTLREFKYIIKCTFAGSDMTGMSVMRQGEKNLQRRSNWPYSDDPYDDPKNTGKIQRARTVQPQIPSLEWFIKEVRKGEEWGDAGGVPWSVTKAQKGGYIGDKPVSQWSNYRAFNKDPEKVVGKNYNKTAFDDEDIDETKDWSPGELQLRTDLDVIRRK